MNVSCMKLSGDGIHDDTAAIQGLLDTGRSCICLPPPEKYYLISKALVIHSNQELRLDKFTVIRLAPGADCVMITNDDHDGGNHHIALTGGIWDMANTEQSPNPLLGRIRSPEKYRPEHYLGVLMRFVNVSHFSMQSLTLRNPVTFSVQFAKLTHFTITDITFEQTSWNPSPNNMDGLHFDGGCRFGKLTNLRGDAHDDLVALNADDAVIESPCFGPIGDIEIDGIFAENCHSAVRLLSAGSLMNNISIRNIHGTFYRYAIGFTQHAPKTGGRGRFEAITLENLFIAKCAAPPETRTKPPPFPLIFCENMVDIENLNISNVHRDENYSTLPLMLIQEGARINTLCWENSSARNRGPEELEVLVNYGEIGHLSMRNIDMKTPGKPVSNHGTIDEQNIHQ